MIGQVKEGAVTLTGDDRKEPARLILDEEGNLRGRCGVLAWLHEADSIVLM
jgi:hypothetical protein